MSLIDTPNKQSILMAYTYLIGWSSLKQYYYGVRYAKDASPDDLWRTYFTSSGLVKRFRKANGEPDIIQIRSQFTNAESATKWENKVLRRIKAKYRKDFINQHDNYAFPVFHGDNNYSKRPEVKKKLSNAAKGRILDQFTINKISRTKRVRYVIKLCKMRRNISVENVSSQHMKSIVKALSFMKTEKPNSTSIISYLNDLVVKFQNRPKHPYIRKVSTKRKGVKHHNRGIRSWYTHVETGEIKKFLTNQQPEKWERRFAKKPRLLPLSETTKNLLSESTSRARSRETPEQIQSRVDKWKLTMKMKESNNENIKSFVD